MANLERTAYPRFPRVITTRDLLQRYTPDADEVAWVSGFARGDRARLSLMVLLKTFQQLHHFPDLATVPPEITSHIRTVMGLKPSIEADYRGSKTLYRHYTAIRTHLNVKGYYGKEAQHIAVRAAYEAAEVMDQRVDIINATIEELIFRRYELPAFSTLDKMAEAAASTAQDRLYARVDQDLTEERRAFLDGLLSTDFARRQSAFQALKALPKRATKKHLEGLLDQLAWLNTLGDVDEPLRHAPASKLQHLAHQAALLDADDLRRTVPQRRYALMLALIHRMRVRARDDLAEMFIRRVSALHKRARDELLQIQLHQRSMAEQLVAKLDDVLAILLEESDDLPAGRRIRALLTPNGDSAKLREDCAVIQQAGGSNHLPLLWRFFTSHRPVLMRLARTLEFVSATQNQSLIAAMTVVLANESRRVEWISAEVDLQFCSERWRKLILRPEIDGPAINRRYLEMCVFSHLASELKSGDTCVAGSEAYADFREHLLPWPECEARLVTFCAKVDIPSTAADCVAELKQRLADTATQLDAAFPDLKSDLAIGAEGEPVLRRLQAREIPASAIALQSALSRELPTRNLLDILANIEHWTHFTRHFGPISGHEPKIKQAAERYLQTIFAMGCNLGPNQAARHFVGDVSPHMISRVNRRHVTIEKLEAATRELAELYLRLDLPRAWGDGKRVAADGTQYDFYDQNLLAGYHFRYKKMGAVAYRHVANNYIATFRHFIPPGVWEAIYVIEGLLQAKLSVEPDTVYSDTQGQSATVFAFTYLLGINLLPRIRNWKDLDFFRPDKQARYTHIESLFHGSIDWSLIERHWQDLLQVAISIQAGKISSPLLLRRLGASSQRNRLFLAAQELGRAHRTVFLLKWIGSLPLRQEVTSETNKIESYNGFAKFLSFGGDVIAENDPDEQQKRLRYNDLIASAVILQNTVDMMRAMQKLNDDGLEISGVDVSCLSPYVTSGIKRFGDYRLDLKRPPEPWIRDRTLRAAVKAARASAAIVEEQREAADE
ncbi:Tn3 family transposase [Dyella sp. ASV21]|uniref:Tn3 family transposase n=1 Tax=Dyella sp. ASV21 TaxID=2795114 RepID=UPI001E614269|nr:Tn3 family transposase [Dyella sp. ASV21]